MGKKDRREKKQSHKKKHSKEKKKHNKAKRKHLRKNSSSSSSSSNSETGSSLNGSKTNQTKDFVKTTTDSIQDEINWSNLFAEKYTWKREKVEPKKERYILDKPGQSSRELNPYWKDGGNGLPPQSKDIIIKTNEDYDVKSLKRLFEKEKDIADIMGKPLDHRATKEQDLLAKTKQTFQVSVNENNEDEDLMVIQSCSRMTEMRNYTFFKGSGKKSNFMKPGEGSISTNYMMTHKQNWRKKNERESNSDELISSQSRSLKDAGQDVSNTGETKSLLTDNELNALAAKKIKAEIMGDKALAKILENEIENAKKARSEYEVARGSKPESKKEVVVVVPKPVMEKLRNSQGDDHVADEYSRKRRIGEPHKDNEKLQYCKDGDKHSLKSMFETEKLGGMEYSNELYMELSKRGKFGQNNDDNYLDDNFVDEVRCNDYERRVGERERNRAIDEARTQHKILSNCQWCLDGDNAMKHLIISVGMKCYLRLPSGKSLTNGHCLIVPTHHDVCGTQLDEDVWNEMRTYRIRLCKMFEEAGQVVVFFENARSFNRFPHMILHCVPMDKEIGDLAPIYFKKAIMESEMEWSNNVKLIDLRNKDLRRSVPKGLPYFTVDFGRDGGFAHVIENEKLFPPNFAEEIIGGMLDLDSASWRRQRKESLECQKVKVKEFLTRWEKYEDTHV